VPVSIAREKIAGIFHHMALSYWKAGMRNQALGAWVESLRRVKHGTIRRRITSVTNPYGMAKQASEMLDDQHAFYGVQLSRYLRSKKSHKLGTRAEVDMVVELVDEHWRQIRQSGLLDGLSYPERLEHFRGTTIVFPFLSVPERLAAEDLAIDFCHGRRVGPKDRCVCGSGLLYETCHGRIPGIDEVLTGRF